MHIFVKRPGNEWYIFILMVQCFIHFKSSSVLPSFHVVQQKGILNYCTHPSQCWQNKVLTFLRHIFCTLWWLQVRKILRWQIANLLGNASRRRNHVFMVKHVFHKSQFSYGLQTACLYFWAFYYLHFYITLNSKWLSYFFFTPYLNFNYILLLNLLRLFYRAAYTRIFSVILAPYLSFVLSDSYILVFITSIYCYTKWTIHVYT